MATKPAEKTLSLKALLEDTPPNRAITEGKFEKILAAYNERAGEDKEKALAGVRLYWWRAFPRIDHKKTGRRHTNIAVIECVRTVEGGAPEITELPTDIRGYTTSLLGGGRYRLILNDKQSNNSGNQVCMTTLKIDHLQDDPILDPREIDENDTETAQWVTRQLSTGGLVRLASGELAMPGTQGARQQQTNSAGGNGANGDLANIAIEAIRNRDSVGEKATQAALDMVVNTHEHMMDKAKAATPDAQLLIQLAGVMKGGDSIGAMVPLLITMITESSRQNMEMFKLILTTQRTPAAAAITADAEDQAAGVTVAERMLALITKMAAGNKPSMWDQVRELIPTLLPLLLPLLMRGGAGPGAGIPPQLLAMMAGMNGATAPAPPGGGVPPGGPGAGAAPSISQDAINDLAGHALRAMERGQDGADFASAIDTWHSPETYNQLRALGKQQLASALVQSPFGAQFQARMPQVDQFLDEFLAYGDPPAPGAESGVPPGGAPPPAAQPTSSVAGGI